MQDKEQSLRVTKFYNLGHWSMDATRHARQSVNGQADADGDVQTDTLILKQRGAQLQLRLTLGDDREGASNPESLIDLCASSDYVFWTTRVPQERAASAPDNSATNEFVPLKPKPAAWGKTIAVPERFQETTATRVEVSGAVRLRFPWFSSTGRTFCSGLS
jgi:hypothetical protein